MNKVFTSTAVAVLMFTGSVVPAFAQGGSGGGGTLPPVTCATDIRNLKLESGGNKGGHISPSIPNSMHITAFFTYVSCVTWGIPQTDFYDHVTGELVASRTTNMSAFGIPEVMSETASNLEFSHQYDVVITTRDYFSGIVTNQVTASIVTQNKL